LSLSDFFSPIPCLKKIKTGDREIETERERARLKDIHRREGIRLPDIEKREKKSKEKDEKEKKHSISLSFSLFCIFSLSLCVDPVCIHVYC